MNLDYNEKHWSNPCPKYDCRKAACKCGLKYVNIPASLGDDSEGSNVAPKNGAYCNALVIYEANNHVYIYSKEGVPTLIDVDASDISTLEQEVRKAQKDVHELREDIDDFIYGYDTVAQMKAATNLNNGDIVRTLGYYNKNDGGGIVYKIRNYNIGESANEINKIALSDFLLAEAIIPDIVCPEMFGAYGDGTHDDYGVLDFIFNLDNSIVCMSGKTYLSNTGLTLTKRKSINFGLSTIKFTNEGVGLTVNMIHSSDENHRRFSPVIENLVLDGFNTTKLLYIVNSYKGLMQNIYVNNFQNIGIEKAGGYEMVLDNIFLWGSNQNTNSIGLLVSSNDSEYGNIFGRNCHTGVKITGAANHFKQIHMWIGRDNHDSPMADGDALYHNSAMIEIAVSGAGANQFDYVYIDSYQYGFKYTGYGRVTVNSAYMLCPDLTLLTPNYTTYPIYFIYAEDDPLKYLYRFSIANLLYGHSTSGVTQKMIPDSYAGRPIRVTGSTIAPECNNLKTDFIDHFTFNHCTNVNLVADYVGDDMLHIHGMVRHDDTTSTFYIAPVAAGVYKPIKSNEIKIGQTSASMYFGASTNFPYNIGTTTVGQLDTGIADNYYLLDYYMKIASYN